MQRRNFLQLSLANLLLLNDLLACSPPKKTQMIHRAIPSTGEKLPVLGLGTWRVFDVGQSESARNIRKEVLQNLVKLGGKIIDTSPMYGSSQEVVGDLALNLDAMNHFFYANKVWTSGKQAGISQMNESFKKMRCKVIDLMQVHNLVDVQTHLKTLRQMKEEGKIKYIGISHYHSGAYEEMIQLIKTESLDFVHFNYNLVRREAEEQLLPLAKEKGLAVLINRPFEEGALFGQVRGKKLPEWVKEQGIENWAGFFLKFVLSHPAVTFTIPGTSNPAHLIENMQAAMGNLPDEKIRKKMISVI